MKWAAPAGFEDFACAASRCGHTCCAGWEIDIDGDSARRYRALKGPMGDRLRRAMEEGEDGPRFRLEDGRCPMLNENGLCDLITACGKDMLCDICRQHPRYFAQFAGRLEAGLGLCCEAAVRLWLGRREPFFVEVLDDDGVEEAPDENGRLLLALRGWLLSVCTDRGRPLDGRLRIVSPEGFALNVGEAAAFLSGLERMDGEWERVLAAACAGGKRRVPGIPLEQLCAQLLYRHMPGVLKDGLVRERAAFAVLFTRLCREAARAGYPLEEAVRLFSCEIEYSTVNTDAVLEWLSERTETEKNS